MRSCIRCASHGFQRCSFRFLFTYPTPEAPVWFQFESVAVTRAPNVLPELGWPSALEFLIVDLFFFVPLGTFGESKLASLAPLVASVALQRDYMYFY